MEGNLLDFGEDSSVAAGNNVNISPASANFLDPNQQQLQETNEWAFFEQETNFDPLLENNKNDDGLFGAPQDENGASSELEELQEMPHDKYTLGPNKLAALWAMVDSGFACALEPPPVAEEEQQQQRQQNNEEEDDLRPFMCVLSCVLAPYPPVLQVRQEDAIRIGGLFGMTPNDMDASQKALFVHPFGIVEKETLAARMIAAEKFHPFYCADRFDDPALLARWREQELVTTRQGIINLDGDRRLVIRISAVRWRTAGADVALLLDQNKFKAATSLIKKKKKSLTSPLGGGHATTVLDAQSAGTRSLMAHMAALLESEKYRIYVTAEIRGIKRQTVAVQDNDGKGAMWLEFMDWGIGDLQPEEEVKLMLWRQGKGYTECLAQTKLRIADMFPEPLEGWIEMTPMMNPNQRGSNLENAHREANVWACYGTHASSIARAGNPDSDQPPPRPLSLWKVEDRHHAQFVHLVDLFGEADKTDTQMQQLRGVLLPSYRDRFGVGKPFELLTIARWHTARLKVDSGVAAWSECSAAVFAMQDELALTACTMYELQAGQAIQSMIFALAVNLLMIIGQGQAVVDSCLRVAVEVCQRCRSESSPSLSDVLTLSMTRLAKMRYRDAVYAACVAHAMHTASSSNAAPAVFAAFGTGAMNPKVLKSLCESVEASVRADLSLLATHAPEEAAQAYGTALVDLIAFDIFALISTYHSLAPESADANRKNSTNPEEEGWSKETVESVMAESTLFEIHAAIVRVTQILSATGANCESLHHAFTPLLFRWVDRTTQEMTMHVRDSVPHDAWTPLPNAFVSYPFVFAFSGMERAVRIFIDLSVRSRGLIDSFASSLTKITFEYVKQVAEIVEKEGKADPDPLARVRILFKTPSNDAPAAVAKSLFSKAKRIVQEELDRGKTTAPVTASGLALPPDFEPPVLITEQGCVRMCCVVAACVRIRNHLDAMAAHLNANSIPVPSSVEGGAAWERIEKGQQIVIQGQLKPIVMACRYLIGEALKRFADTTQILTILSAIFSANLRFMRVKTDLPIYTIISTHIWHEILVSLSLYLTNPNAPKVFKTLDLCMETCSPLNSEQRRNENQNVWDALNKH